MKVYLADIYSDARTLGLSERVEASNWHTAFARAAKRGKARFSRRGIKQMTIKLRNLGDK